MTDHLVERSVTQGFSIEKLAKSYRDKLNSVSSKGVNNNLRVEEQIHKLISKNKASKLETPEQFNLYKDHWANRDYRDYYGAA
ncbi:hypothetical protein [Prochlorococcus marinus]|uniref:hypothetical protein n=1 Tax=Prochlorococcus marinus TaxID=1219 RepID=UPI0022B416E3|nr:hypothetical protein [Prochlorococcus marinus]